MDLQRKCGPDKLRGSQGSLTRTYYFEAGESLSRSFLFNQINGFPFDLHTNGYDCFLARAFVFAQKIDHVLLHLLSKKLKERHFSSSASVLSRSNSFLFPTGRGARE